MVTMSLRIQIWLIFLAPVVLLAALYAFGLSIPVPHLGRGYVIRMELPQSGTPVDLPPIYGPADRSRRSRARPPKKSAPPNIATAPPQ